MTDYSTLAMLRRQYGTISIPLAQVRRNYFPHIGSDAYLLRLVREGKITLRIVKEEYGGKAHKVVYLHDLADFLDAMYMRLLADSPDDEYMPSPAEFLAAVHVHRRIPGDPDDPDDRSSD